MTQRRLILVRHAKTEQGGVDLDRALTGRGRRDAREIGRWLAANDHAPDRVALSPSVRTRETWQIAGEQLDSTATVVEDQRIYDNSVGDLLAVAQDTDPSVRTLVVVGHNPSVHGCAVGMLGGVGDEAAEQLREFPTATIAVFDVDGEWTDVGSKPATLVAISTCRG